MVLFFKQRTLQKETMKRGTYLLQIGRIFPARNFCTHILGSWKNPLNRQQISTSLYFFFLYSVRSLKKRTTLKMFILFCLVYTNSVLFNLLCFCIHIYFTLTHTFTRSYTRTLRHALTHTHTRTISTSLLKTFTYFDFYRQLVSCSP